MPLLEQDIPHLLGGVSQRPEPQRGPSVLEASKNALAQFATGLMKRPPAKHVGKLDANSWDFDKAALHSIDRDADDEFRVAVEGGTVKVFDALTGNAATVLDKTGDSQAYLSDDSEGYRMVTVGDTTVVVNQAVQVKKGSTKSPNRKLEDAYVTVEQADFSTEYTITLAGRSVTHITVDQVDARSRGQITTEHIAQELVDKLSGGTFPSSNFFDIERFGSTIYISPLGAPEATYEITVDDGLGGNGLHLVKGAAQSFEDLPAYAKHGAVVEVTGDPTRDVDDYFVRYDASEAGDAEHGVWKETVAPGVVQDFDDTTMPHALIYKGRLIEKGLEDTDVPGKPDIETTEETKEVRGFTEERVPTELVEDTPELGDATLTELSTMVPEERDDLLDRHKARLRRPIPNPDGSERDVDVRFNVDTSLVRTGLETRINVSKVDSDGIRTLLKQNSYRPGDTFSEEAIEIRREPFAVGDEIELELEYGDGFDQPVDRRAELEAVGGRKDVNLAGYKTVRKPTIEIRKRRFVELTYSYDKTWPNDAEIRVELDGSVEFTYLVPSSGDSNSGVAAGLAGLIDGHGSYQASSSGGTVSISTSSGSSYPTVTKLESEMPDTVFYSPDLDLAGVDLSGYTAKNLTDGSEGTISSNTDRTITCSLSGGVDNKWQAGDVIHVEDAGKYFVFKPIEWDLRNAGDIKSNPWPSFTENTIEDVFFWRNRLGFVSGEHVVLSRSGDLFQFFRTSVVELLADDRIDIRSAHSEISLFHSAVKWNGELQLWTGSAQFALGSGGEPLTQRTITLDLLSQFDNDPGVRPVVAGSNLFFVAGENEVTRVYRYSPGTRGREAQAQDLTRQVPDLLSGQPQDLAANGNLGVLAVSTKGDPAAIYVYTWTLRGNDLIHAGWNRWELPSGARVGKLDHIDDRFGVLSTHGNDGTYLSEINLNVSLTPGSDEKGRYLDRRVHFPNGGSSFSLPYDPQVPGDIRVFDRDTGTVYDPTVTGSTVTPPVDLTGQDVWVGSKIDFEAEPTILRIRDRRNVGEQRGRLQLRTLDVQYHDTTDLDVQVTPKGRAQYTKSLSLADPRDGELRVPMMSRAEDTTIKFVNSTPGGVRISSLSWEGYFNRRSEQV